MYQAPQNTMMVDNVAISFVGLFLLLFLLAGFVVVVLLLANQKTRPFALALLGLGGISLLLLSGLFWVSTVEHAPQIEQMNRYPREVLIPAPQVEFDAVRRDSQAIVSMEDFVTQLNRPSDGAAKSKSPEEELMQNAKKAMSSDRAEDGEGESVDKNKIEAIPDWVVSLPSSVGGVHRQVVDSGPWSELADCQNSLDDRIREAVTERVKQIASEDLRKVVYGIPTLEYLGISNDWIQQNVACSHPGRYVHTSNSSVGPMKTVYAQLEFDPNDQEYLRQRYRDYVRRDRIAAVTAGGSFILGGIGLLFGLLKVDTWTKGYYTKRLFLGVPAAIIGTGALLALMMS